MTDQEKNEYWLTFHRFQQNREKYFAPRIYRALDNQVNEFIESYKSGLRGELAFFNIKPDEINNILLPLYQDAGKVYGAKIRAYLNRQKARMPIGFNERMVALMTEYYMSDILSASEITDTTKEIIQRILTKATEEGQGFDWVVSELYKLGFTNRQRARLIARTETVTAANKGAMIAAKDTGLLLQKEWLATNDNRTRHDHRMVNGQKVDYNEFFTLPENVKMSQPGDRGEAGRIVPAKDVINCRCTTIFEPMRDRTGKLIRA